MRNQGDVRYNWAFVVALAAGLGLSAPAIAAAPSLKADFNGDGYDDLAIGVPGLGEVSVIYGSRKGLTSDGNQLWSRDTRGLKGSRGAFDRLGTALAAGDFDGDGYADLAVGVPGDKVGNASGAGTVNVIYGSPAGLTVTGNQLWHKNSLGVPGIARDNERLGSTLASGDFDGDGKDDLAIGAQNEAIGSKSNAGRVYVLYGSGNGLTSKGSQDWHQNVKGIPDKAESADHFGSRLAAGDFNGDGRDDLVIGVLLESVKSGSFPQGAVHVLYGSRRGLAVKGNQFWHRGVRGVVGPLIGAQNFGTSLATGDFDNDGKDDLAVGVPGDDGGPNIYASGSVNVIYGSSRGLTASRVQFWSQGTKGIPGKDEVDDYFGTGLAAGDFDGDGSDDLAIGIPNENVGQVFDAGVALVLYSKGNGLSTSRNRVWHQNSKGVEDKADTNEKLGQAMFAGDFNGDGRADLAVGVPGEYLKNVNQAGAINVLYGSRRGIRAAGDQIWHRRSPGIQGNPQGGTGFGFIMP